MKFRGTFIVLCLSACIIFISSCASLGPVYQKAEPPEGKAVIYIYRPSALYAVAVKYTVWDVTNPIITKKVTIVYDMGKEHPRIDKFQEGKESASELTILTSGSYYAYTVDPGTYYFMVGTIGGFSHTGAATDFITKVEAKAGNRYFLYSAMFVSGPWIYIRTAEEGEKEIADCKQVIKENN